MMSIIDQIKAHRINAMKAKDTVQKNVLTTLLGEIQREQVTPSETPSDELVLSRVKFMLKS